MQPISRENLVKGISYLVGAVATALLIIFGLSSCNVTRIVSTTSSYIQHGDTTTTIVTKTVESYDGSKKF